MFVSIQITNNEIFAFLAVPDFTLSSHKVLFIIRKHNKKSSKVGYFLRK